MNISATNTSYAGYDVTRIASSPTERATTESQKLLEIAKSLEEDVVYTRGDFFKKPKAHARVTVNENGASAHRSKTIVQNYINNGMTALEAVNAYKAQLAYGTSSNVNGVSLLSSQSTDT